MPKLTNPSGKPKVLPPIYPNAGVAVAYRTRLDRLIARMQKSISYWLSAAYKANPPALAMDASAAAELAATMRRLGRQWLDKFNKGAEELGRWFTKQASARSDAALKAILKNAGWTVKLRQTPMWQDVQTATIQANVELIKSIASQHLSDVQGLVMRSVQEGRDLATLTQELERRYGLTRKRAALIARDQNNKATSAMTRVRQQELGITKAIWVHSYAGKEPRPTHLANDGKAYDVVTGWRDPAIDKLIWPGTEINCRCTSRSIIVGLQ